jgi:hypothetical protein
MIQVNEDLRTIELTRGDSTGNGFNKIAFKLPYYDGATKQEKDHEFLPEDKISFVVMTKKGYTKSEVFRKEYTLREIGYFEPTTIVEIPLSSLDTKCFPLTNKKATYWYDIVLNDSTTVLGFDSEGASKIIVYPEAGE